MEDIEKALELLQKAIDDHDNVSRITVAITLKKTPKAKSKPE